MNEENVERIERYLKENLSPSELIEFEAEMSENEELRNQVEFMQHMPKAVQLHNEIALRQQLKALEKDLPIVKFEQELISDEAKEISLPNSVSTFQWRRYAIAASILLVVGLFIFKNQIFNRVNENQIAETELDKSLNEIKKIDITDAKQVAVLSLKVNTVKDSKFGFVKNSLEKKITLVIEVDSTLLSEGIKYGKYKFQSDSLFLLTGKLITNIEVYEFDVAAQRGEIIDSIGQLFEYEKPTLKGLYISSLGYYFKIEITGVYSPLTKVKSSEAEALKFYTK